MYSFFNYTYKLFDQEVFFSVLKIIKMIYYYQTWAQASRLAVSNYLAVLIIENQFLKTLICNW